MKVRCVYCKEFVDRETAIRQGLVSFCDEEHRKAWWDEARLRRKAAAMAQPKRRKTRTTPASGDNPKGYVRARSGVLGETRRAVFVADAWKCRFCGKYSTGLQCHHVIYRSDGVGQPWLHEASNLITLCQECHETVHSDKHRWQPLCLGIIWLRGTTKNDWLTIPNLEHYFAKQSKEIGDDNKQEADPD